MIMDFSYDYHATLSPAEKSKGLKMLKIDPGHVPPFIEQSTVNGYISRKHVYTRSSVTLQNERLIAVENRTTPPILLKMLLPKTSVRVK